MCRELQPYLDGDLDGIGIKRLDVHGLERRMYGYKHVHGVDERI
jgi:hypothetical protein